LDEKSASRRIEPAAKLSSFQNVFDLFDKQSASIIESVKEILFRTRCKKFIDRLSRALPMSVIIKDQKPAIGK
jgi:hypothetical protein